MNGERSLEELLYHMKSIARVASSDWERNFARSILRHARRPSWEPTTRQEQVMRRLVSEKMSHNSNDTADNIEVIEEFAEGGSGAA